MQVIKVHIPGTIYIDQKHIEIDYEFDDDKDPDFYGNL